MGPASEAPVSEFRDFNSALTHSAAWEAADCTESHLEDGTCAITL